MLKKINYFDSRVLLPKRRENSYKGQNGKVLIVGGSLTYHGAPILSAMGALNSGADLVYIYTPECNFEVTRGHSPDFIVKKYPGEYLVERYAEDIILIGKTCDSILIGPGIGKNEKTMAAVLQILKGLNTPTVLDADAIGVLKDIEDFPFDQDIVITPNRHEFNNLVDREIEVKEADSKSIILLRSISMDLHINVLLKGPVDYVSSYEGEIVTNHTGNSGMTVGGSGDVLSGMVATFMAQGMEGFQASKCAAYYFGKVGDFLKRHKGVYYTATDLATAIPYVLK